MRDKTKDYIIYKIEGGVPFFMPRDNILTCPFGCSNTEPTGEKIKDGWYYCTECSRIWARIMKDTDLFAEQFITIKDD